MTPTWVRSKLSHKLQLIFLYLALCPILSARNKDLLIDHLSLYLMRLANESFNQTILETVIGKYDMQRYSFYDEPVS